MSARWFHQMLHHSFKWILRQGYSCTTTLDSLMKSDRLPIYTTMSLHADASHKVLFHSRVCDVKTSLSSRFTFYIAFLHSLPGIGQILSAQHYQFVLYFIILKWYRPAPQVQPPLCTSVHLAPCTRGTQGCQGAGAQPAQWGPVFSERRAWEFGGWRTKRTGWMARWHGRFLQTIIQLF